MKKVLVTGGSGFIGGAVTTRLRRGGCTVWAPPRAEMDLSSALPETCPRGGVDVVVHCAASRDRYHQDATRWSDELGINVDATLRLYEWAKRHRIRAVVQLSTISVLEPAADPGVLLDESSPQVVAPSSPYALTKRWGEEVAVSLRSAFEAVAIVRPGMTYGPGQHALGACARKAEGVRRGEAQKLAAPRGHRFAPVFVDDVSDVIARLVAQPENVVVNVAGPDAILEADMLRDLGARLGRAPVLEVDETERAVSIAPDTRRVDALFPQRIKTRWLDGLARTFQ